MNTIDLFALIAERAKLLEAFVKKEITNDVFRAELERLNALITSY